MSARYYLRGLLGAIITGAAVAIAAIEVYHLTRTGSCASGGPYVSARPCPRGTGLRILGLIGSIFALGPLGVALYASRAKGISGLPGAGAIGALVWCYLWIAMGSAAFVAGHGPAATDASAGGATGVAITFWGIGGLSLIGVIFGFVGARKAMRDPRVATLRNAAATAPKVVSTPPPAPPKVPASGVAQRLEQLDELKAMGAVTPEEYTAKRAEILNDI